MESEEEYNQDRKNLLKIVVDTGDDYPEYDNSSEDSSISSIDSSSNDMDVDKISENFEEFDIKLLFLMIDKKRMTDKTSSIYLKIIIRIQTLIVLQTQKCFHGKELKYMLCMSIILYLENFLKIKENQDHHLKN